MVSFATKKDDPRAHAEIEREAKGFFIMVGSLQSIHLGDVYTEEFINELYQYVFFDPLFVSIILMIIPIESWFYSLKQIKYRYIEIFKENLNRVIVFLFASSLDRLRFLAYSNFPLESLCPLYNALLMNCKHVLKARGLIWTAYGYYDLEKCRNNGFSSFPTRPKKK